MACKGISKGERGTQQKRGGVVGLVIIAAPILPLGQSVQSIHLKGRLEEPPWLQVTPDGKYIILDPIERFYNDLPHDVAQHWATQVTHQSESYRTLTLDYDAWNHVPTTYVFCKQDNIAPIRDEATLRELIKNPSIEHVDSGHAPFLSKPRETLNIIRRAAGEKDIGASL
ncbi:MAG: hypothetical protein M1828_004463 [Chrysothrix sp. TS-e1954]|nr:MAG: hypothetical protein M1828_004463 [Chrysothrix sp. TS-e1954]